MVALPLPIDASYLHVGPYLVLLALNLLHSEGGLSTICSCIHLILHSGPRVLCTDSPPLSTKFDPFPTLTEALQYLVSKAGTSVPALLDLQRDPCLPSADTQIQCQVQTSSVCILSSPAAHKAQSFVISLQDTPGDSFRVLGF